MSATGGAVFSGQYAVTLAIAAWGSSEAPQKQITDSCPLERSGSQLSSSTFFASVIPAARSHGQFFMTWRLRFHSDAAISAV
jgi:hypothetical protein